MNIPQASVHRYHDDEVMLDVREPAEWSAGHAANAVNVPLGQLPGHLDRLPSTAGPLPVICRSGVRSAEAVAFLIGHGIDATNVAGGMQAWQDAGKPLKAQHGTARVL